jgi:glucose/arabinose dehydrogenase
MSNKRFSVASVLALGVLLWALAACNRSSEPTPQSAPPPAEPTSSGMPATTAATHPPALDANLLTAEGVTFQCDASQAETLNCQVAQLPHRVEAQINASIFGRWSMRLPPEMPALTGREVLAITLRIEGTLRPNLYLVEADGRRILQRLPGLSPAEGGTSAGTVYVPLNEVRDEEFRPLNSATLQELQLVFEWADMEGVLEIEDIRFLSAWREVVTPPTQTAPIVAPDGFVVEPIAAEASAITQFQVVAADTLLVSQQNGRIWWYRDLNGDGFYEERQLYASGFEEIVGLLYDPLEGAVWVGGRGNLWRTMDTDDDGVADQFDLRIEGLPWGRHQNNGLIWNPVPDPFTGEPPYTWIYFGLGSTGDLETGGDLNATVLRLHRDRRGQDALEVVARGVRNAYGLLWAPVPHEGSILWSLFAGENGPDFNSAPDEVNHIRWGLHYGFPEQFGMVDPPEQEGQPYSSPVLEVTPHASANSLAYITNPEWPEAYRTLYVSLFGSVFSAEPVKPAVERIRLTPVNAPDGVTFRGEASLFLDNLSRPLPLATDLDGNLLVGDYGTGIIYRVRYAGTP